MAKKNNWLARQLARLIQGHYDVDPEQVEDLPGVNLTELAKGLLSTDNGISERARRKIENAAGTVRDANEIRSELRGDGSSGGRVTTGRRNPEG